MKRLFTILLLTTLPFAAHAESRLDQLERISETMSDSMFAAMIRMVERQGGNPEPLRAAVPDGSWDDEYRTAGRCLLNKLTDASSEKAVDKMLTDMEAALPKMATMDLESMGDDMNFTPDGISDDFMLDVNQECGLIALSMQRMEASGFSAAMMQSMAGN